MAIDLSGIRNYKTALAFFKKYDNDGDGSITREEAAASNSPDLMGLDGLDPGDTVELTEIIQEAKKQNGGVCSQEQMDAVNRAYAAVGDNHNEAAALVASGMDPVEFEQLRGTLLTKYNIHPVVLDELFMSGLLPAQIVSLLETIATRVNNKSIGSPYYRLPDTVSALQAAGLSDDEIVSFLTDLANSSEAYNLEFFLKELPTLLKGISRENARDYLKGILFVERFGADPHELAKAHEYLGLDFSRCTSREGLAQEIADKTNMKLEGRDSAYLASPEAEKGAREIAELIDILHERDGSDDLIRITICSKLKTESKVILVSLAGRCLFTSTFLMMYEDIRNTEDLPGMLKEIDPDGALTRGFILTLGSFNRLTEIVENNPDFFIENIEALLNEKDPKKLTENVYCLINTIGGIMSDEKLSPYKSRIEASLLLNYSEAVTRGDKRSAACIGFLIKYYRDSFSPENAAEVDRICAGLPEVLAPRVPESWIVNNTITAKLYFYKDENSFKLIQDEYRKKGFKITPSPDGQTVTMTKVVNGITLKVIITQDNSDVADAFSDPSIAIIGHRGHSFHLSDTFEDAEGVSNKGKLLYLGSCGSYRDAFDLMDNYYGNFFVGVDGTGRGHVNNEVLYYTMCSIANGERDWEEIGASVGSQVDMDKNGIVMPQEGGFLFFSFLAAAEGS